MEITATFCCSPWSTGVDKENWKLVCCRTVPLARPQLSKVKVAAQHVALSISGTFTVHLWLLDDWATARCLKIIICINCNLVSFIYHPGRLMSLQIDGAYHFTHPFAWLWKLKAWQKLYGAEYRDWHRLYISRWLVENSGSHSSIAGS